MSEAENDPVVGHINGGEISVRNSTGAGNSNFHEDGPEPSLSDDCATSGKTTTNRYLLLLHWERQLIHP
ncbi:hypothetical protein JHK84_029869 [Glycine max]|nr:hypothetical protein JHK84_029869 [Glycine max]